MRQVTRLDDKLLSAIAEACATLAVIFMLTGMFVCAPVLMLLGMYEDRQKGAPP